MIRRWLGVLIVIWSRIGYDYDLAASASCNTAELFLRLQQCSFYDGSSSDGGTSILALLKNKR